MKFAHWEVKMATLLTEELVRKAIDIALPTIRLLVKEATWGPLGLVIIVDSDYLDKQVIYTMDELGPKETWSDRHEKDIDFEAIAQQKLNVARKGLDSHVIVSERPWLLESGDSFYQGGVCPYWGLAIATSGAYGTTDCQCAKIIVAIITALCQAKINKFIDSGIGALP
jgi:hypothetical protein